MKTCGLDVHKDSIFCAVYDGKSYSEVKEYETTNPKIRQMGEYLRKEGVERIAMESTSTYWVPIWDILLEMGFELMLCNPFLIKQMPGRKSDVKDAQWIACLLHKGMLRGSMIPSPIIQELRTCTIIDVGVIVKDFEDLQLCNGIGQEYGGCNKTWLSVVRHVQIDNRQHMSVVEALQGVD